MEPFEIVAVSAGLSQPSSTRLLADRLVEATRRPLESRSARPVNVQVVELREWAVDIAQSLVSGCPVPALRAAVEAVTGADGVIAVTPIFNASYNGLFKSFVDVVDTAGLAAKPVLIGATGGTARHSLALDHVVRPLFAHLSSHVVRTAVYAASEDWGAGDAGSDGLGARITRAGQELAGLVLAEQAGR